MQEAITRAYVDAGRPSKTSFTWYRSMHPLLKIITSATTSSTFSIILVKSAWLKPVLLVSQLNVIWWSLRWHASLIRTVHYTISPPSVGDVMKYVGYMPAKSTSMDKTPTNVIKVIKFCRKLLAGLRFCLSAPEFSYLYENVPVLY